MTIDVTVPDIGDFSDVEIIEVLVAEGDEVEEEASLITLESDKATMEIPSPVNGRVVSLKVAVGDRVGEAAHRRPDEVLRGGGVLVEVAEPSEGDEVVQRRRGVGPLTAQRPPCRHRTACRTSSACCSAAETGASAARRGR